MAQLDVPEPAAFRSNHSCRTSRSMYIFWVIIIGFAICNMMIIPEISSSSTLLFKTEIKKPNNDTIKELGNDGEKEEEEEEDEEEAKRLETAVIMVTALLPSHPATWVVEKALHSVWSNLDGLHPRTNIYITVDPPKDLDKEKLEILDQYTRALYHRFSGEEYRHVKIIVNSVNRHVNGSLGKVVFDLLDTNITKYIYVLQHDLIFMPGKIINHTAIVNTFDKYYADETVQLVGFSKDPNSRTLNSGEYPCQARADLGLENPLKIYEGEWNETDTAIYLTHSGYWSDQNHFTTVQYYRDLITRIGPVPRFPEDPMRVAANKDCRLYGTHWYGLPDDGSYICHLDATKAYKMGICPKHFWESD